MKNIFILFLVLMFFSSCKNLKPYDFKFPYYYIGADNLNINIVKNDTIFMYKSISTNPDSEYSFFRNSSKIIELKKIEENYFLLLTKEIQKHNIGNGKNKNYSLMIFNTNQEGVEYKYFKSNLTLKQALNYSLDTIDYIKAFGIKLYNQQTIKEFSKLKRIKNIQDIEKIENKRKNNSNKYKKIISSYKENYKGIDPYYTLINNQLINQYCLDAGYNPVDYRPIKDILKSKKMNDSVNQEKINYYFKYINP